MTLMTPMTSNMLTATETGFAWVFEPFDGLSLRTLYEVLQLRSAVFVVEQTCIFQDLDGSDEQAMHLLGRSDGQLVAYARCFPAGVKYAQASIGRVITRSSARSSGLGHELMRRAVAAVGARWGAAPICIGAQARLEKFYNQHGFAKVGPVYDEDGIDHIEMLRPA
jgi:ElaA protein